jgi:hypothetical protein
LPTLLGPANVLSGTANSASATSPAGSPLGVLARPDLLTDQGTGSRAAFGLMHPAPGDREEPLPEQFLIPPDQDWFEPTPQPIEQTVPTGNLLLRNPINFQAGVPKIVQPLPVDDQDFDARSEDLPSGILLDEAADEEQPDEQSGISAAAALIACGIGAYWAPRFRSSRRTAAALLVREGDI